MPNLPPAGGPVAGQYAAQQDDEPLALRVQLSESAADALGGQVAEECGGVR
jgi:hypothetical protein